MKRKFLDEMDGLLPRSIDVSRAVFKRYKGCDGLPSFLGGAPAPVPPPPPPAKPKVFFSTDLTQSYASVAVVPPCSSEERYDPETSAQDYGSRREVAPVFASSSSPSSDDSDRCETPECIDVEAMDLYHPEEVVASVAAPPSSTQCEESPPPPRSDSPPPPPKTPLPDLPPQSPKTPAPEPPSKTSAP